MSGFQHDIAGGQGNLVITSVQSPNYSAGVSGWQIRKDGSAEFNNLVIRGTFFGTDFILASTGFFLYSGTPALGNLSASAVPGSSTVTDPEGNTAQPGFTVYGGGGAFGQLLAGQANFVATSGQFGPGQVYEANSGELLLQSGQQISGDTAAVIALFSLDANGSQTEISLQASATQATGTLITGGDMTVNSANLNVGNGATANINVNPKMATPPNAAAVAAGTATLAQLNAFCNGLYTSLKNRGMFN